MKMWDFCKYFMKMWFCFTAFYISWQTDTKLGRDAAEACGNSKEKHQLRDLFLNNE